MTPQPEYVTGGWTPQNTWEDLRAILDSPNMIDAVEKRKAFEARYLINGLLLLTPKMIAQLWGEPDRMVVQGPIASTDPGLPPPGVTLFNSLSVKVIAPNQVVELGDGFQAVSFDEKIYVFKMVDLEDRVDEALLASWRRALRKVDPDLYWAKGDRRAELRSTDQQDRHRLVHRHPGAQ